MLLVVIARLGVWGRRLACSSNCRHSSSLIDGAQHLSLSEACAHKSARAKSCRSLFTGGILDV